MTQEFALKIAWNNFLLKKALLISETPRMFNAEQLQYEIRSTFSITALIIKMNKVRKVGNGEREFTNSRLFIQKGHCTSCTSYTFPSLDEKTYRYDGNHGFSRKKE